MTRTRHERNPIQHHHADQPLSSFVAVPNHLVRARELDTDAFRVLCLLASHVDGFEESVSAIAERYGWGRQRVRNALHALEAASLLVIQRCQTSRGTRAFERYHVSLSRTFTPAEREALRTTDVVGGPHTTKPVDHIKPETRADSDHAGEPSQDTKEEQVKTQYNTTQHTIENSKPDIATASTPTNTSEKALSVVRMFEADIPQTKVFSILSQARRLLESGISTNELQRRLHDWTTAERTRDQSPRDL